MEPLSPSVIEMACGTIALVTQAENKEYVWDFLFSSPRKEEADSL